MSDPKLAQFDGQYISLETFQKNGPGVKTPAWFDATTSLVEGDERVDQPAQAGDDQNRDRGRMSRHLDARRVSPDVY